MRIFSGFNATANHSVRPADVASIRGEVGSVASGANEIPASAGSRTRFSLLKKLSIGKGADGPRSQNESKSSAVNVAGQGNLLSAVNLEKHNLLTRLFPSGIQNSHFAQGDLGDCVFVAGLKSTCQNNPQEIVNMINPGRVPGTVTIQFHGRDTVTLNETDFKRMGMHGDAGAQLLERAYGLSLKKFLGQSSRKRLNRLRESSVLPALNSGKKTVHVHAPMEETHSPWSTLWQSPRSWTINAEQKPLAGAQRQKVEQFLEDMAKDPQRHVAIVVPRFTRSEKLSQIPVDGFTRNHAYSLTAVDSKRRMVTLANPWRSDKPIRIGYDAFFANFSNITMTDRRPREPVRKKLQKSSDG